MNSRWEDFIYVLLFCVIVMGVWRISSFVEWYVKVIVVEKKFQPDGPISLKEFLQDWAEDD